jgi:hypothetical protein
VTWVSGSVNWGKAGRHFKLETCAKIQLESDCFIWMEMDPIHWLVVPSFIITKEAA